MRLDGGNFSLEVGMRRKAISLSLSNNIERASRKSTKKRQLNAAKKSCSLIALPLKRNSNAA